jgi:hypothetical protein
MGNAQITRRKSEGKMDYRMTEAGWQTTDDIRLEN